MLCYRSLSFSLLTTFLFFSSTFFSFSHGEPHFPTIQTTPTSGKVNEGKYGVVVSLGTRRLLVEGPSGNESVGNSTIALAAERTHRKDPLDGFKRYTGGWNISERHYWASVGFTAAPLFVIAGVWFVVFGMCLSLICLCYCCCRREPYGYSRTAYAFSLIFLILFTTAAIVGCVVLYTGQGKFHNSTTKTLQYVVTQANTTVEKLRNVSEYLAAAKLIRVDQVFLPSNVQTDIDQIETKINSSASTLSDRALDNSNDIQDLLDSVRLALIIIAAIMLVLTFLGFLFSIFGMQFLVYILVIIGWILVAGTFILCGIFLLLHNVTADTCVAMNQWVQNPTSHTALDDILPCVDNATAQETLLRSKEVTSQLVNVINQVITNVSNINFSPNFVPLYYNQSGPLMPTLCNPFNSDFTNRVCSAGEVDLSNATQVWQNYVCHVSRSGICTTTGRLTPAFYNQMAAAVNVSYGLSHYGPFLVDLEDCTFVRQTFSDISRDHCPGLRRYSEWIYVGLVLVSAAVMLSLVFWVIYGRERRHRVYTKAHMPK
uniref:Transmembrane protein n=2 Tax=Davidia involucrata TaxID=16924 RepID=A0A5B7A766_DAVIN